jgi:hypothetical protein
VALAVSILAACSSSNSGGPASSDVTGDTNAAYCLGTMNSGGTFGCQGYKNATAADVATYKAGCTRVGRTVVPSCPTAGLVGCCTYEAPSPTSGQVTIESCSYNDPNTSGSQMSCAAISGKWSTTM